MMMMMTMMTSLHQPASKKDPFYESWKHPKWLTHVFDDKRLHEPSTISEASLENLSRVGGHDLFRCLALSNQFKWRKVEAGFFKMLDPAPGKATRYLIPPHKILELCKMHQLCRCFSLADTYIWLPNDSPAQRIWPESRHANLCGAVALHPNPVEQFSYILT